MSILYLQTAFPTFTNDGFIMEILTFLKNQSFVLEDRFGSVLALFRAPFGSSWGYFVSSLGLRTPRSTFVVPQTERRTLRSTFGAAKDERRTLCSTFGAPKDERRTLRSTFVVPPKMNVERSVLRSEVLDVDFELTNCLPNLQK